jgi:hypothetical protein
MVVMVALAAAEESEVQQPALTIPQELEPQIKVMMAVEDLEMLELIRKVAVEVALVLPVVMLRQMLPEMAEMV